MTRMRNSTCPRCAGKVNRNVKGPARLCETKRRRGRRRRKLNKIRVVKRVWWRGGSGTKLLSEKIVVEIRNSRGRVVGGESLRMTPRSRMGGRSVFRACEIASCRAGAGVDCALKGGVA